MPALMSTVTIKLMLMNVKAATILNQTNMGLRKDSSKEGSKETWKKVRGTSKQ